MTTPAGRVAIVTGAGSGIGLEAARQLSARGFAVALVGRTREKLEAAASGLAGKSLVLAGDVADAEFAHSVVGKAGVLGDLEVLVNAAGVAHLAPIPGHTPGMIRESFATNAVAPAMLMALVWPVMVARGGGRIVNVSSMASIDPFDGFFAYAASKVGVNMLTKVGDKEGRGVGIRCFCVAPGAVETPMLRSMFTSAMVPESRALPAAEVADLIVRCATGQRDAQGGETIVVQRAV